MNTSTTRQRKTFLVVSSVLCLIYTVHVTVKTFVTIDKRCETSNDIKAVFGREIFYKFNISRPVNSYDSLSKAEYVKKDNIVPRFDRTDYFGCDDFAKLPDTTQAIAENTKGNRGISFIKVRIDGVVISAVYKQAGRVLRTFSDEYKYNTAMREIEYLTKLRGLPGVPHIFGSCVKEANITYLVERVFGHTMCNDNGTTVNCSNANFLMESVAQSSDPPLAALKVAYTTARLFKLLEERHLFFEDISGVNLMFTPEFEVVLVDADSLVFYNETRLFSKLLCTRDDHCPGPTGNLWIEGSLNSRIYKSCSDVEGLCEHGRCRGFGVSLHACGMAEWYICKLAGFLKDLPDIFSGFQSVCTCMHEGFPHNRCSFATATTKLETLLLSYENSKES